MMNRGGWLICLLAFTIGALATTTTEEVVGKDESSVKSATLRGYLEKIKKSPFNAKSEVTEGKKGGGVTSATLERIKQMVSQRDSHGGNADLGNVASNVFEFGDLSFGHPGAHEYIKKPYSTAIPPYGGVPPYGGIPPYGGMPQYGGMPPYSGGGMAPYTGGGVPPYTGGGMPPYTGGGMPPYSGGGTYKPGDSLPDVDYSNQHPLSIYDYEHIWIEMLKEMYNIMKNKNLLDDYTLPSKVLDHLFKMLNDIKILGRHTVETEPSCPKIYNRIGDLCLSVDFLTTFLDYHEARLYCQVVKGGDLVIWRDANEFDYIQRFIKDIDSSGSYSYWVGVSERNDDDWRFTDGRAVEMGAPFWGVNEHRKIYTDGGYGGDDYSPPHSGEMGYGGGYGGDAPPPSYEIGPGPGYGGDAPPPSYETGTGSGYDGAKTRDTRALGSKRRQVKGSRRATSKGSKRKTNTRPIVRGGGGGGEANYNKGGNKYSNKEPLGENTIYELEPGHDYDDEDYGILSNDDFHYLHAISMGEAEEMNTIPLCQYVPERDQANFQYGEMVYEGWNDYNEWSGWDDKDKLIYKKLPPHSHYSSHKPQKGRPQRPPPYNQYGGNSYGGSYGTNPYGGTSSGGSPYGVNPSPGGSLYGGNPSPGGNTYGRNRSPGPETPVKEKKEKS